MERRKEEVEEMEGSKVQEQKNVRQVQILQINWCGGASEPSLSFCVWGPW